LFHQQILRGEIGEGKGPDTANFAGTKKKGIPILVTKEMKRRNPTKGCGLIRYAGGLGYIPRWVIPVCFPTKGMGKRPMPVGDKSWYYTMGKASVGEPYFVAVEGGHRSLISVELWCRSDGKKKGKRKSD